MSKTVAVLWLTLAATLAASWTHLAQFLARHESPGWWPVAAMAATAVDLGIVAAMLAISDMAAAGRSTAGPRWTVAGLVALSCLVNAAHVVAVGASASTAELALAIIASAALPLIVWRLSLLLDALRRPVDVPVAVASKAPARKPAANSSTSSNSSPAPIPLRTSPARNGSAGKWHAAIARHGADNSLSELARLEGVSRQAVSQWKAAANGREVAG